MSAEMQTKQYQDVAALRTTMFVAALRVERSREEMLRAVAERAAEIGVAEARRLALEGRLPGTSHLQLKLERAYAAHREAQSSYGQAWRAGNWSARLRGAAGD